MFALGKQTLGIFVPGLFALGKKKLGKISKSFWEATPPDGG
jgi:hypothetical protein